MFTQAIAKMPYHQAQYGLQRLKKLDICSGDNQSNFVKIIREDNSAYVLLRQDTPNDVFQWLCGFFAAL